MKEFLTTLWDNLGFVGICAAIVVGLYLLSKLSERFLPAPRKVSATRRITIVAISSAVAMILHLLKFPLPFLAPAFYELDFSELPVLLCGFYLGPSAAVACEGLKVILKLLLTGTTTAFVGDFANFAVGCALVLPAVVIYHTKKSKRSAILGLLAGILCMSIFGSIFNALYLIPRFAQMFTMEGILSAGQQIHPGIDSVWMLVLYCVVPLNLVKSLSVSILTLLLYKRVARPLFGN